MKRTKRTVNERPWPDHWEVSFSMTLLGRDVTPGVMLKIPYQGQFKFLRHVRNTRTGTEWVDVMGDDTDKQFHAYRPERFTKVFAPRVKRSRAGRAIEDVAPV